MAINGVVAFVELLLDPEASKRIRRALSTLILASLSWKINIYPAILCRYFFAFLPTGCVRLRNSLETSMTKFR